MAAGTVNTWLIARLTAEAGVWGSTDELAETWQLDRRFEPTMSRQDADTRQAGWRQAVERARGSVPQEEAPS